MFVGKTYIPIRNSSSSVGGRCVHPEGLEAVVYWIVCIGFIGVCLVLSLVFLRHLKEEWGVIGFIGGLFLSMLLVGLACMPMVCCLL